MTWIIKKNAYVNSVTVLVCGLKELEVVTEQYHNFVDRLFLGDAENVLAGMPDSFVQCVVTSPEYYGNQRWEKTTLSDMVEAQARVFKECFRVLKDDGVMFVNVNDIFDKKEREYLNYPFRLEMAIRDLGFKCPQPVIIWERDTALVNKSRIQDVWEYILIFSKSLSPKFNKDRIQVPAKYNKKRQLDRTGTATKSCPNIWKINKVFSNGKSHTKVHSCPFPHELVENCLRLATDEGDIVLDPYSGSSTSCYVSRSMGRRYIGIEVNEEYYNDSLKNMEAGSSVSNTCDYVPSSSDKQPSLFGV